MKEALKLWVKSELLRVDGKMNTTRTIKTTTFYKENTDTFNAINTLVNLDVSLSQKCKFLLQDIIEHPRCGCGKKVKLSANCKFREFCSVKCSSNSEKKKSQIIETKNNDIVDGLNMHQRIGIKAKNTLLVEDESGLNGYDKIVISCMKSKLIKYGDPYYTNREKAKESIMKRYGKTNWCNPNKSVNTKKNTFINGKSLLDIGIIKSQKTKIKLGTVVHPDLRHYRDWYKEIVRRESNKNFVKYYHHINPFKYKRSKEDFHLDHIFSIEERFKNNIPVWLMSHPCNLQMLSMNHNVQKNKRCDITIDELLYNIKDFEKRY